MRDGGSPPESKQARSGGRGLRAVSGRRTVAQKEHEHEEGRDVGQGVEEGARPLAEPARSVRRPRQRTRQRRWRSPPRPAKTPSRAVPRPPSRSRIRLGARRRPPPRPATTSRQASPAASEPHPCHRRSHRRAGGVGWREPSRASASPRLPSPSCLGRTKDAGSAHPWGGPQSVLGHLGGVATGMLGAQVDTASCGNPPKPCAMPPSPLAGLRGCADKGHNRLSHGKRPGLSNDRPCYKTGNGQRLSASADKHVGRGPTCAPLPPREEPQCPSKPVRARPWSRRA